jgi:ferric-dicitrate binding protein FerR (iron transport regulator)
MTHSNVPFLSIGTLLVVGLSISRMLVGQTTQEEAHVASVAGPVLVSRNSQALDSVIRGDALSPGDEIDTREGGRLTIALSDGSLIVVQQGSRVVLKDFRSASTLQELFDIVIGRVRVKIHHYGGRPNPYRINSPTASIAVRGTEFSVIVDMAGDTRVFVFEGLVEVTSLSEPNERIVVEPGRGVIVRPNQPIRYFTAAPGHDLTERGLPPLIRNR